MKVLTYNNLSRFFLFIFKQHAKILLEQLIKRILLNG
uniref:Uncharacterized protein n=1 Tax=Rhizophora mucronata TaxID=61149 RepID=A0A2P2PG20_RHIMU